MNSIQIVSILCLFTSSLRNYTTTNNIWTVLDLCLFTGIVNVVEILEQRETKSNREES